ncbi:MAG: ABC transporter ATP-binding protein [Eubacteriales bacterium]
MLICNNLVKKFGGLTAINSVSIEVLKGEIAGIIGPNGAGKTTFFNLISGFIKPDGGEVIYNGVGITRLPPHLICQKGIGRTFQIVKPFGEMSVIENVMVGAILHDRRLPGARQYSMEVLEKVGLNKKSQLPAKHLTLAERKRLEVARALATKPRLILLDEIMAGLNPTEVSVTLQLVRDIHKDGVTVIMIEHNMPAVMSLSNHVVVLNNGEKIFEGTPAEVSRERKVIEAYLGEEYMLA